MGFSPDTKWLDYKNDSWRWKHAQHLHVRRSPRGYWLAKMNGLGRPTQHASRESAKRSLELRAKRVHGGA